MKKTRMFLLDLLRAAVFSIRTGEGFIILHEEQWLEQQREHSMVKRERQLMWDCIDSMIAGGHPCEYCAFDDDPNCTPGAHGCCWALRNLTDEEVRACEPCPAQSAGQSDAGV